MITCECCKRTAGQGAFGSNWLCEDCRVGVVRKKIGNLSSGGHTAAGNSPHGVQPDREQGTQLKNGNGLGMDRQ
ncbi:hypothetical protein [Paenibacillus hexagrammi]|uniref:Uncharacterized protein n=1 Tax=Paenibacillus hexagrammi TaxID=2908839 RepID=A0ABY3SIH6_9BACL|nr:hypothetical protein [Paenibacillus sp. YPD9-1]UJF33847.1 hypothetical protein L0M14_00855 [Paenibacillus sp. YPD9-1]